MLIFRPGNKAEDCLDCRRKPQILKSFCGRSPRPPLRGALTPCYIPPPTLRRYLVGFANSVQSLPRLGPTFQNSGSAPGNTPFSGPDTRFSGTNIFSAGSNMFPFRYNASSELNACLGNKSAFVSPLSTRF